MSVAPGSTKTLTFDLPPVPPEALATLKARLETVWTGYKDPDPKDYIGLTLTICPGDLVVGFLPLP